MEPNGRTQWKQRIRWNGSVGHPLPDIYETRLRWGSDQWKKFTIGASAANTHVTVRANSVHDPDWAYGGKHPYGYEAFQYIYSYYIVKRVKWKFTCISEGQVQDQLNYMFAIHHPGSRSVPGQFVNYSNMKRYVPDAKFKPLGAFGQGGLVYKNVMYGTWYPETIWPARNIYENPNYWGHVYPSTNPTSIALLIFGVVRDPLDTDTPAALDYRFKVECYYDVVFVKRSQYWSADMDAMMIPWETYEDTHGYGEDDDDGEPTADTVNQNATGDTTDMPDWYVDDP